MDFYQKVELANPSSLMLESSLLELLYEVQTALTPPTSEKDGFIQPDIKHAWTIEGKPIKSIMDLHQ